MLPVLHVDEAMSVSRRGLFSFLAFLGLFCLFYKSRQAPDQNPCWTTKCSGSSRSLRKLVKSLLIPPVSPDTPYSFDKSPPSLKGQLNQPVIIDRLLGGLRNGFFIECGAYDGEDLSNSLLFELKRNWTGLLIEANPRTFTKLATRGRKAFLLNAGLSIHNKSEAMTFWSTPFAGGMFETLNKTKGIKEVKDILSARDTEKQLTFSYQALTVPLFTVLQELGNPVVDLFSLDVEGAEAKILRTIPFDKVKIKMILLEYSNDPAIVDEFDEILSPHGFQIIHYFSIQDVLFSTIPLEDLVDVDD